MVLKEPASGKLKVERFLHTLFSIIDQGIDQVDKSAVCESENN